MTSGDPLSAKNASGFFESDLLKKYATDLHRFSEAILARRISAKLGCDPSMDVVTATFFFAIFGHFRRIWTLFCYAQTPVDLLYSCRFVVDILPIVDLLRISYGFVVRCNQSVCLSVCWLACFRCWTRNYCLSLSRVRSVRLASVRQNAHNRERTCAENYNKWHNIFFLNCNQHFGNFKP